MCRLELKRVGARIQKPNKIKYGLFKLAYPIRHDVQKDPEGMVRDDQQTLPHPCLVLLNGLILQIVEHGTEAGQLHVHDTKRLQLVDGQQVGALGEVELVDVGDNLGRRLQEGQNGLAELIQIILSTGWY